MPTEPAPLTLSEAVHRAVKACDRRPRGPRPRARGGLRGARPPGGVTDDDEELLVLAARAEYNGSPPEHVQAWLEERGVAT